MDQFQWLSNLSPAPLETSPGLNIPERLFYTQTHKVSFLLENTYSWEESEREKCTYNLSGKSRSSGVVRGRANRVAVPLNTRLFYMPRFHNSVYKLKRGG